MTFRLTAFAFVALSALSCSRAPSQSAPRSSGLAEVGGETISESEIELEMQQTPPGADVRGRALQSVLQRKRMVAEAKAAGLSDEAETRRALDGVLVRRLLEKQLQPRIDALSVSEADIAARFEERKSALLVPGTTTLAMLFLPSNPEDKVRREADRKKFTELAPEVARLEPATGFGGLAVENSQHQETRFRGGLLPPFADNLPEEGWRGRLLAAVTGLAVGALTPVIETPDGLYLARIVERAQSRSRNLSEVRDELRRDLLREAETAEREKFREALTGKYPDRITQG